MDSAVRGAHPSGAQIQAAAAARRESSSSTSSAAAVTTIFPGCARDVPPLRISSYNIYFGSAPRERLVERTNGISQLAFGSDLAADAIAFQEVIEDSEAILRMAAEVSGYKYLSLHCGAPVEPAAKGGRASRCRYWAALAIGPRLQLLWAATYPFTRSVMDRHLVLAVCRRLPIDGGGLVVISTSHLESMPPMAAARAMQMAEVDTRIGLAVEKALKSYPDLLAAGPPVLVFTGDTNLENGEVRGDGMGPGRLPRRKAKRPEEKEELVHDYDAPAAAIAGGATAEGAPVAAAESGSSSAVTAAAPSTATAAGSGAVASAPASAAASPTGESVFDMDPSGDESGVPLPAGWSDAWVALGCPADTRWTFDLSANDTFGYGAEGGRRARLDRLFTIDWNARAAALAAKARGTAVSVGVVATGAASSAGAAAGGAGAGEVPERASKPEAEAEAEAAAPPPLQPSRMSLLGTDRLPCGRFASDHWGIVVDLAHKPKPKPEATAASRATE